MAIMRTIHVVPPDGSDRVMHDLSDDCVCGPRQEAQPGGGWVVIHASLDGRESAEAAPNCIGCDLPVGRHFRFCRFASTNTDAIIVDPDLAG